MAKKKVILEFCIPNWALCYLINGDPFEAGSEEQNEQDEQKLTAFTDRIIAKYGNANFSLPSDEQLDLGFKHSNDIDNIGSDCSMLLLIPTK